MNVIDIEQSFEFIQLFLFVVLISLQESPDLSNLADSSDWHMQKLTFTSKTQDNCW